MKVRIIRVPKELKGKMVGDIVNMIARTLPCHSIVPVGPWGRLEDSMPLVLNIEDRSIVQKIRQDLKFKVEEVR